MKNLLTALSILLIAVVCHAQNPSIEQKLSTNDIMNAYVGLKFSDISNNELREQLKSYVDGTKDVEGNEWDIRSYRSQSLKEDPEVEERIRNLLDVLSLNELAMASSMLASIASKDFGSIDFKQIENERGEFSVVIPEDIGRSKIYLKYAVQILEDYRDSFKTHPDAEDLEKLLVNQLRIIDLYDEVQDTFINYLETVNNDYRKRKKALRVYEKKLKEYEIESRKVYIYQSQKIDSLMGKYRVNIDFNANESALLLREIEKKYEKSY